MLIRAATVADLPAVERLRLAALSGGDTSVWRGVPFETQVRVRLRLWDSTPAALDGVLVGLDGDRLIGTVAISTTATATRFSPRMLPALAPLRPARAARFVAVWLLTHHEPAPDEAFLFGMVIDAAYRRRSAARALTTAAEERARQWGKRFTSLTVERTNAPSLALATGLGYRFHEPPPHRGLRRLVMPPPSYLRAEKPLDVHSGHHG